MGSKLKTLLAFDATPLNPATAYELRITDPGGAPLCDAWPLKTSPAPDATAERMRILDYTCAGGYDGPSYNGKTFFLDMRARRKHSRLHDTGFGAPGNCSSSNVGSVGDPMLSSVSTTSAHFGLPTPGRI
jgi:hypothetical protein